MIRAEKNIDTHIFPFLWLHGESHEKLYEEIKAIRDCGLKMFCVESRPHPEFCEEGWWNDLEFIFETAETFDMKVWILDDKHYPTGCANDAIERYPNLKPHQIRAYQVDFWSDGNPCRFIVNGENDDMLIASFCFPKKGDGIDYEKGIEITDGLNGQVQTLCVPSGFYRLVVLYDTTRFPELDGFIDMLNPDSAYLQIKEVYEPHYERFKSRFGSTLVGFFSDEPRFSSGRSESSRVNRNMYQTTLGLMGVAYPYRTDIPALLGIKTNKELVALWYDTGEQSADFRVRYMNLITRLYEENFSKRIGDWCEQRGVLYTGHITEDMGNHCRLGSGAGHFFRSMSGQHIAGIDVVLHQIESGFSRTRHLYPCPGTYDDPMFFHFVLAKLGVSAAHLEPRKKNRTMCEIFGAYGWGETLAQMKWLVDFMLVRGVNYFVPHAFNPKLDDADCPPYFYHGGNNPTFGAFGALMRYTEKMCQELSGEYTVDVGVLYHAEAEWSGKVYSAIDKICKELTEHQIDFEIVPSEYINRTKCKILLVPYAKYLSDDIKKSLTTFNGKVLILKREESFIKKLTSIITRPYYLKRYDRDIRVLERNGKYFVFNEGVYDSNNTLYTPKREYPIFLKAGESVLLDTVSKVERVWEEELTDNSQIAVKDAFEKEFLSLGEGSCLDDLNEKEGYERFVGTVQYKICFETELNAKRYELDFGRLSGGLKVKLNGEEVGYCFGMPYRIDITDYIKTNNELSFELSTTLALEYLDHYSTYCRIDKCGLNEKIILKKRI